MSYWPERRRWRDRLVSKASAALYLKCALLGVVLRYAALFAIAGLLLLDDYGIDLGTPPARSPTRSIIDVLEVVVIAPAFETILMTLVLEPSAWLLRHAAIIPSAIIVIAAVQLHHDDLPTNVFVATTFAGFCVQYVWLRPRQGVTTTVRGVAITHATINLLAVLHRFGVPT